jgi:hypothetical protein
MRLRRLALLSLTLVAACDISQSCDQEFEPARGNLDRLSDVVLVTPPGQDEPAHTFAILANPEIEQLRIFDTFDANFVRGPNLFFPLAIRTGPSTRRLAATPERPTRVFALDGANDEILVVRTVDEDEGEAFTVADRFSTGRAPADLAARPRGEDGLDLFVALPDAGAVEVLDESGATVATIALPDGARPARLDVDPTGDAVIVTDGALSAVHIIRADDRALDRSLEVGGPTLELDTGVVDVGDGLAPVAVVLRQDAAEAVALRLFRPGYREDRYAVLARVLLPKPGTAAFVPDQAQGVSAACFDADPDNDGACPKVCCDVPSSEDEAFADEATLAWAGVMTLDGDMHYLRLDAERGRVRTGERTLEPAPLGLRFARRFGARFFDAPTILDEAFEGTGTAIDSTSLCIEPVDNLGDPPLAPLTDDVELALEFEGIPGLANNRRAFASGGELSVTGRALDDSDVRAGDLAELTLPEGIGAGCPDRLLLDLTSFSGNNFVLDDLEAGDRACLEQADDFRVSFRALDAWVATADSAYVGRLDLDATGDDPVGLPAACGDAAPGDGVQFPGGSLMFEAPGALVGFTAPAGSGRGDVLAVSYGTPSLPVILELGDQPSIVGGGFAAAATLIGGLAGGVFQVADGEGGGDPVRRVFVASGAGAGLLLELAEAESNADNVVGHQ